MTEKVVKLDPKSQVLYFEITPEELEKLGVQPLDSIVIYFGKKSILETYKQIYFSKEEELKEPLWIVLTEDDLEILGPLKPGDKLKVYIRVEKYVPEWAKH